jgi:ATPase subunit of ABC transporter with duplicated ATPase domains
VTTDIIHFHKKQLVYYQGQNYDAFEKTRRDKLEKVKVLQTNLDAKRDHIRESITKMQQQAAKVKKGADDKRLKQVTSRKAKLDRMGFEKTVDGVKFNAQKHSRRIGSINDNQGGWVNRKRTAASQIEGKEKSPNFAFNEVDVVGISNPVMQLDHVYFQYPGTRKPILNDITMAITLSSRLVPFHAPAQILNEPVQIDCLIDIIELQ